MGERNPIIRYGEHGNTHFSVKDKIKSKGVAGVMISLVIWFFQFQSCLLALRAQQIEFLAFSLVLFYRLLTNLCPAHCKIKFAITELIYS